MHTVEGPVAKTGGYEMDFHDEYTFNLILASVTAISYPALRI
jgi:hypothetical protein